MNVKQFFEALDNQDFINYVGYKVYQWGEPQEDPEKYQNHPLKDRIKEMNVENTNALKLFANVMIMIRKDPEFWNDIMGYAEEKK